MKFDVIIIGGGLAGVTAATALQQAGLRCALIASGLSLHEAPRSAFREAGGTVLGGEEVVGGTISDGRLQSVRTRRLGDLELEADEFILATGKFFSKGLVADMSRVYEPLFGLDTEFDEDRGTWFSPGFSASQRFLEFGVRTAGGCALKDGETIENLRPVGEILAGMDITAPGATELIRSSALGAAEAILKKHQPCRK